MNSKVRGKKVAGAAKQVAESVGYSVSSVKNKYFNERNSKVSTLLK